MDQLLFTFGELEARLAKMHGIAESKRTAFQARLKNFHRLGFPTDLRSSKGKTSLYSPALVVETALAVELTELGLPPDRVVAILKNSLLPVSLALQNAATVLFEEVRHMPRAQSTTGLRATEGMGTFLTFDPSALWPLTSDAESALDTWDIARLTLFCLRDTAIQRDLIRLTEYSSRISILNVTSLLATVAQPTESVPAGEQHAWVEAFLDQVRAYSANRLNLKSDHVAVLMLERFLTMRGTERVFADDPALARQIAHDTFLPIEAARKAIKAYTKRRSASDGNP